MQVHLAIAGAVILAACSGPAPHGARVFAPRCAGEADLEPAMAGQMSFLDRTLESSGIELERLDMPSKSSLLRSVERAQSGWFLLLYTGHGLRPENAASRLCVGDTGEPVRAECSSSPKVPGDLSVNACVLQALPSSLSGATLVLDACLSAQVDPRKAPVPTSVISSSPYTVGADSLFGDRLAVALSDAVRDPNCDGLVTDQELFDLLLLNVYREVSIAENRAYPKLRRNATSHIPLPVAPEARRECLKIRAEMEELVAARGKRWGALGSALEAQLALRPLAGKKQTLPVAGCSKPLSGADYFVVDPHATRREALVAAARKAGLCEFPEPDPKMAERVARFAIFSEVYLLASDCDWVSVTRLRDRRLMANRPAGEIDAAMPGRRSLSVRAVVSTASEKTDDATLCQFRYLGVVPDIKALEKEVHCAEPEGQCFLEPCPPPEAP